ncbi:hypothetical protein L1281_002328 [Neisseria sp. HSC-16F19]|nr:hypothetical protein [Neisseria sp. HSC-16F19]MCP2041717.1 hypothetical protein [Neisseria sp. HSC-16F19]
MANNLKPIPAKRYFSLDELCRLADISPAQFEAWQHENGVVVGYGGDRYTRQDVLKVRQLSQTFSPYINPFTRNQTDANGNPAIDADEVRSQLQDVLKNIENTLAK